MVSIPYRDRQGAAATGDGYPLGFLITFRCYGTWLDGDERGSIDRGHNSPGEPLLEPNPGLRRYRIRQLERIWRCRSRSLTVAVRTADPRYVPRYMRKAESPGTSERPLENGQGPEFY